MWNFYFQLPTLTRIVGTLGDIQPEDTGAGMKIQLHLVLTAFKEKTQWVQATPSPILK